ncbi:MAG: hypothetical protein R3C19_10140 [Planctomycetaceae bacterium]
MIDSVNKPYSAEVRLTLHANGTAFDLAKVGPDSVYLRHPAELPPCAGEVIVSVDGNATRHPVRLPEGAVMNSRIVRTVDEHV